MTTTPAFSSCGDKRELPETGSAYDSDFVYDSDAESEDSELEYGDSYRFRNVFVRDATGKVIASLRQGCTVAIKNFYRWLGMVLVIEEPWFLKSEGNESVLDRESASTVPEDTYMIVNSGQFLL